jgi:hypothetical protein
MHHTGKGAKQGDGNTGGGRQQAPLLVGCTGRPCVQAMGAPEAGHYSRGCLLGRRRSIWEPITTPHNGAPRAAAAGAARGAGEGCKVGLCRHGPDDARPATALGENGGPACKTRPGAACRHSQPCIRAPWGPGPRGALARAGAAGPSHVGSH